VFGLGWQVCERVFWAGVCWDEPRTWAFLGELFLVTRSPISELQKDGSLVDLVVCGWPFEQLPKLGACQGLWLLLSYGSIIYYTTTAEKITKLSLFYILMAPHLVSVTRRLRPPSCHRVSPSHWHGHNPAP
jgi:hypothetical protein